MESINHAGDRKGAKEISKMRSTCKSHTMTKGQKASAVRTKKTSRIQGPKPTNVKTFKNNV
jgi:hypothetical protein